MVFYGLAYSVQDLGLSSINTNGIFFGVTQTAGYLIILPFSHKLPRKKLFIYCELLTLAGAAILGVLSHMDKTAWVKLLETIVSTCLMTVVNSIQFVFYYAYISESFPPQIRGSANALCLFTSKLIGSCYPYLKSLSLDNGFHIMCGCSLITVLAFPVTLYCWETLVLRKEEDDGDSSVDAGDYRAQRSKEIAMEGEDGQDEMLTNGDGSTILFKGRNDTISSAITNTLAD